MKNTQTIIILILFLLSGCSTSNYYLVTASSDTDIYQAENSTDIVTKIPKGKFFISKSASLSTYTEYGKFKGYSRNILMISQQKLTKKKYENLLFSLTDGYTYIPKTGNHSKTIESPSTGGTVQVKGYTRKDGTYVKPHTRSAPRRH